MADSDSGLDSEDEAERKVAGLESEMDRLYDIYQGKMREKDAKYKVKESRKNNPERWEEWNGIPEKNSDEEEGSDEGGWEDMQEAKDHDSDSSEDSDSDGDRGDLIDRKRRRGDDGGSPEVSKRVRLVTKLDDRKPEGASRVSQVWFSQDVFSGIEGLDDIEDGQDEDENEDEEEDAEMDDPKYLRNSVSLFPVTLHCNILWLWNSPDP